jgi:hypothetical protein
MREMLHKVEQPDLVASWRQAFDAVWRFCEPISKMRIAPLNSTALLAMHAFSRFGGHYGCKALHAAELAPLAAGFERAWGDACDALLGGTIDEKVFISAGIPSEITRRLCQSAKAFLVRFKSWKLKDERKWQARLTIRAATMRVAMKFAASRKSRARFAEYLRRDRAWIIKTLGEPVLRAVERERGIVDEPLPSESPVPDAEVSAEEDLPSRGAAFESLEMRQLLMHDLVEEDYSMVRESLWDMVLSKQATTMRSVPGPVDVDPPALAAWTEGRGSRKVATEAILATHVYLSDLETPLEAERFSLEWQQLVPGLFAPVLDGGTVWALLRCLYRRMVGMSGGAQ